jgi:hypothetical protein
MALKTKPKKFLIFDAGPIISLTMNGLLDILEKFKTHCSKQGIEFVITPEVKKEVIDKPLGIKKYGLEGVKVKNLLDKGVLVLSSEFVSNQALQKQTKQILKQVNSAFIDRKMKQKINLIQEGEASCLAFAKLCSCENIIAVDERTTRMIAEAPEKLIKLMEKKLHTSLDVNISKLTDFKKLRFIRSSEILYMAYKKELFDMKKDKILLDALLYGVKFKGAAISSREIEDIKKFA